jgi:titin
VVQGNWVGTNAAGTAAVANGFAGVAIVLGASHNLIGGTAPGAGNVLSGNADNGVFLEGAGTAGNVVQGNRIGVGVTGGALANGTGTGVRRRARELSYELHKIEPQAGPVVG